MASFEYKVRTVDKNIIVGTIEASNQKAAITDLHQKKYMILSIKEKGSTLPFKLTGFSIKPGAKINQKTLVIFSRQLATLINAGIPIIQSLNILIEEERNKRF
ncbi:type II secretion system F family protein, partial [bacterium]|nr:type II secretion system F family protein [bacterium]